MPLRAQVGRVPLQHLTPLFPEVATAAAVQLAPGIVLDGEFVVWSDGRLDFGALQASMSRSPRSAASLARQQHPLSPGARRALVPWLAPPAGPHPWPQTVAPGAFGRFNTNRTDPVDLTLVEPLVVEVSADVAWSGTSFRHALRLIRVRPDAEASGVEPP